MRFGHADGQLAEPVLLIRVELATRAHVVLNTSRPVYLLGDGFDLLPQRSLIRVEKRELGRLSGALRDRLGEFHSSAPPSEKWLHTATRALISPAISRMA